MMYANDDPSVLSDDSTVDDSTADPITSTEGPQEASSSEISVSDDDPAVTDPTTSDSSDVRNIFINTYIFYLVLSLFLWRTFFSDLRL